ncbi:hypothetical protein M434DRAFT_86046, partial [Hypoxylon sp. CO27-5]
TKQYRDDVRKYMPIVHGFYRFYEAPRLLHFLDDEQPTIVFDVLLEWAEKGTALGSLSTILTSADRKMNDRIPCSYQQHKI